MRGASFVFFCFSKQQETEQETGEKNEVLSQSMVCSISGRAENTESRAKGACGRP